MLTFLVKVVLVHEEAHIEHATFADGPTPEKIKGMAQHGKKTRGTDINGNEYWMGESGFSAEVALTGGQGEVLVVFEKGEDKDYSKLNHFVLTNDSSQESYITSKSSDVINFLGY